MSITKMPLCECGKSSSHWADGKDMCCECYVRAGYPAADWHTECMRVWLEMTEARKSGDEAG